MKKSTKLHLFFACIALNAICCTFVHRRVILAVMKGQPIPEAPKWHFWVKNRKK